MAEALKAEPIALPALHRTSYTEKWPSATPPSVDVWRRRLEKDIHLDTTVMVWIAYDRQGEVVGRSILGINVDRSDVAELRVYVTPLSRQMGVARLLLRDVAKYASTKGVGVLRAMTLSHVPAGEVVMRRIAATKSRTLRWIETSTDCRALELPDDDCVVDVCQASDLSSDILSQIALLRGLVWTTFNARSTSGSPEADYVKYIAGLVDTGLEIWVSSAVLSSGECVGYSEYLWDPEEPTVLSHSLLALKESHRYGTIAMRLVSARSRIVLARPSITSTRYTRLSKRARPVESGEGVPRAVRGRRAIKLEQSYWDVPLVGIQVYLSR